jgi:hypothetical protein
MENPKNYIRRMDVFRDLVDFRDAEPFRRHEPVRFAPLIRIDSPDAAITAAREIVGAS